MFKTLTMLRDLLGEVKFALKELREAIAALEALAASPDLVTLAAANKEIGEFVESVKTKGK